LHRVRARGERDVLEAVCGAEVVHLRTEHAPVGGRAGGLVEHGGLLAVVTPILAEPFGRRGADHGRSEGRYVGAARRWSCSRCITSWTPAKTSHSPQRRRPTRGCSSGQASASWPSIEWATRAMTRRLCS